jgi:hypothetical protein
LDFSTKGLSALAIHAIVAAWQAGAISRETMTDLFWRGELLPEGHTNEKEVELLRKKAAGSDVMLAMKRSGV